MSQINSSPKLSNSGEPFKKRHKEANLKRLTEHENFFFKFVVNREQDLKEIKEDFLHKFNLDRKNIYVMPAGEDQSELNETRDIVANIAKENYFTYTERQHIVIWNKKTGV